jgi:hypothetical protein
VGGAAAGGVGGYFIEQNASARASMLMLAGGMTLVIPTIVAVLSRTAYSPPDSYVTDKPPADEPIANPPQPDAPPAAAPPAAAPPAAAPAPAAPPAAAPATPASPPASSLPRPTRVAARHRALPPLELTPPALVALRPGALALNVPAVEIQDTYTRTEVAMYGVTQHTEVHIPVLNLVF